MKKCYDNFFLLMNAIKSITNINEEENCCFLQFDINIFTSLMKKEHISSQLYG